MVYFDNAATSAFKPKGVAEVLQYDLAHSANSGRSGHKYALDAAMKIEDCRRFLSAALDAPEQEYCVAFTKNCTEALNLGIFGFLREGMRVVTTAFDHNSVLRPLFELEKRGKIELMVVQPSEKGKILPEHLDRAMENADFCAVNAVSNVTGARLNLAELSKSAKRYGIVTLVDGAQAVPYADISMKNWDSICWRHPDTKACTDRKARDFSFSGATCACNHCSWAARVRRRTALCNLPNRPKPWKRVRCSREE